MSASPTTFGSVPEPVIGDVRQFLQLADGQLEPEPRHTGRRGRPRILPSTCLWAAMLVCPSRRIAITAPDPPLAYAMSIGDRPVPRTPRYAERKCKRREAD